MIGRMRTSAFVGAFDNGTPDGGGSAKFENANFPSEVIDCADGCSGV